MIPDYCTQNNGDCLTCGLVSYGRDCQNNKVWTLGDLAQQVTGGNLAALAKLLNDSGASLDELQPDPGALIPRPALINLATEGGRVGRLAAQALR